MQLFQLQDLSGAISALTAMITPAVLISACSGLILSTITRLHRAVDRVRSLLDRLEELSKTEDELELLEERREVIYRQLEMATRRNRLLERGMRSLYLALGAFVATSVAIGVVAVTGRGFEWLPAVLGLIGACLLAYSAILFIVETRISSASLGLEMDFILRLGKTLVPKKVAEQTADRGMLSIPNMPKFRKRKED
jgi:hypothetical protein